VKGDYGMLDTGYWMLPARQPDIHSGGDDPGRTGILDTGYWMLDKLKNYNNN